MDRRSFLKYCAAAGVVVPSNAWAIPGIMPAKIGGGSSGGAGTLIQTVSWDSWDGTSESALETDQDSDGTEDTLVMLMENPSDDGDETGVGMGLSGSDLVFSYSAGAISGATGTPPYRSITNIYTRMSFTQTLANTTFANANGTWSLFLKGKDFSISNKDNLFSCESYDNGQRNRRVNLFGGDGDFSVTVRNGFGVSESGSTTDDLPNDGSTIAIAGIWADGSKIRYGFVNSTTPPTKWSDFSSTKRGELTSWLGDFSGRSFDGAKKLFNSSGSYGYATLWDCYWWVFSNTCLIDNNS